MLPPKPLTDSSGKLPKFLLGAKSPLTVAFRHLQDGWRNYILYVDIAARNGDLAMGRFRDCYNSLTAKDKWSHWPEQICELSNVTPGELVGAVCRAVWENKAGESSMISSIAHPQVLMKTAELAQDVENYHDRELFFRLTGSLPDKKGASINIFNAGSSNEVKLPELGQTRTRLKSFDEEIIEMSRELEPGPPFLVEKEDSNAGLGEESD